MTTPTQLRDEMQEFTPSANSIDVVAVRRRARRMQLQRRSFCMLAAVGVTGAAVGSTVALNRAPSRTAAGTEPIRIGGREITAFCTVGNAGSGGGIPSSFAFDEKTGRYVALPDGYRPMAVTGRYVLVRKDHEPLDEVRYRYDLRARIPIRLRNAGPASPDGTQILTLERGKNVTGFTITDTSTNTVSHRESWAGHSFHGHTVRNIVWMPDSRSLLVGTATDRTLITGLNGSIRRSLGLSRTVTPQAWSPDGRQVATWHPSPDQGFALLDVASGRRLRAYRFGSGGGDLRWTAGGELLFEDVRKNERHDTDNGRTLDRPIVLDSYTVSGSFIRSYSVPRISPLGFDSVAYQPIYAPLST